MKVNEKHLKLGLGAAVAAGVVGGYIFELRTQLRAMEFRAKYMEQKLNSALTKLTPEKLEEISAEVDKDIAFFHIAKTTLKDTL